MGFFDRFSGRKTESVRIKKNTDDIDGLYYNALTQKDIENGDTIDILNMNEINEFRLLKTERGERYNSFDLMGQDSRVASILNMYADDCTQYNQSGKVIWAESSNPDAAEFANRLIENLQLNKYAWTHIYSLCKYGDLYLELFYDDELKDSNKIKINNNYKRERGAALTETIQMVKNPASMFDLVKRGKTEMFIKINSVDDNSTVASQKLNSQKYNLSKEDIVYPADKFIHIAINDAYNRFPNKYVLTNSDTNEEVEYDVKEGNSILANVFKVWSELNLLEDSVLLNRLSKSAIIRLIQIEVGNTDDDEVQNILKTLRDKISRSRYMDKSTGTYKNQVNPGPLENIIYHATHQGNGAITHSTIGGDVDVKALADIDLFLEKFAQGFPIPVAYVRQKNDDGGGLSAGTSLTKFDARYGRTLKRYQTAYMSGITDLINVFAYKRGLTKYINDFNIKMVSPSAVEDNERDEKLRAHTDIIRDLMNVIDTEKYTDDTKKKVLNYLIQSMLQDNELNDILSKAVDDESEDGGVPDDVIDDNQINMNDEVEI